MFYRSKQIIQHYQMSLRANLIITILTISLSLICSLDSNASVHVIPLNRTDHHRISIIVKRQHGLRVALGTSKGGIDIIDIQRGKVIKTIKQLSNSIRQIISYGTNGHFFARDIKKTIMFDYQGNIVYKWAPKEPIVGMALASNTKTTGYLALVHYKFIEEFQFSQKPSNETQPQQKIYDGFYNGIKIAALTIDHRYLHVVSDQHKRFTLVDPTISQEVEMKPRRSDSPTSQIQQTKSPFQKQQSQCPNKTEGSENKNPKQTRTKHGEVIVERQFNFKIMDLVSDLKDLRHADREGLMMVTNESVIYAVKKGSLVTFIPYRQQIDDKLLAYSFCQTRYFLTLHKSSRQGQTSFYLSFFQKSTFIKEKVVEVGTFDVQGNDISMDCNGGTIVVLANDRLIVVKNSYHQEEQQIEAYPTFIIYGQWALTALILLLFLCCCKGQKQPQDTDVQNLLKELGDQSQFEQSQEPNEQKENNSSSTVQGTKADNSERREDSKSKKEGCGVSKERRKRKSG